MYVLLSTDHAINLILSIETLGRIEIDLHLIDKKIINVLSLIHCAEDSLNF